MSKIKSIVKRIEIDRAIKAHNCQANSKHRLEKGDLRLKVQNGRSWDHYCAGCTEKILTTGIKQLEVALAKTQQKADGDMV